MLWRDQNVGWLFTGTNRSAPRGKTTRSRRQFALKVRDGGVPERGGEVALRLRASFHNPLSWLNPGLQPTPARLKKA